MLRRERLSVVGTEAVGPYTLLRVERGALDPGIPGQFFMLEAPGRLLPRPMSLCLAPPGELAFLIDPIGPGTRALCALAPGDGSASSARSATASTSTSSGRCSSAAGSASRRCRTSRSGSAARRRCSASAASWHAEAAALVPNAEVVLEPTYVTEAMPAGHDVLACGPEPMLEAVRRLDAGRAARLGGADGLRLRRLLRLRGRDRRRAEAPLRRRAGPCGCLTPAAASTR